MRIGLVSAHSRPPARSEHAGYGTHQHVARLAAELTTRGHDVRVYERRDDPDTPATSEVAGYLVERAPIGPAARESPARMVPLLPQLGHWLTERWSEGWTPEVVHGHFWISGLVAANAVRQTDIPVVQSFHSIGAEQQRRLGAAYVGPSERIPLERALTRAVDLAVAQSTDEADELTRMGLQRALVAVVPVGVDIVQFCPDGEAAPRERQARVLAVANLEPSHALDDLIRAMSLIGDAELVIIGGPGGEELARDAEARRLTELAQRCGIGDRVRLVGSVPHDQLCAWYRSADVVACTPRCASVGRVPLEAMACGVPVVGYALGGIADTVVDEVTGLLVPAGDVRSLGMTLRRLLVDDAQRFAYGHAAVDRARCSFTWERAAGALERIYDRVVDQRRPAPV